MHSSAQFGTYRPSAFCAALRFLRANVGALLLTSALLLVPCSWHRHIQAGDLGSHVYNAWLADLITQGRAPGLYIVSQWNNVLCDIALLYTAKAIGFWAAEKIVVGASVLIFFWGVFAFVAAISGRPPWSLTPLVGMLAYGYAFNMGFLNYYTSLGLACFGLALVWSGGAGNWLLFLPIAFLTWLAHPIGFLWFMGMLFYGAARHALPALWKLAVPAAALGAVYAVHWYLAQKAEFAVDWTVMAWCRRTGADQFAVYGPRYKILSSAVLGFALVATAIHWILKLTGHVKQKPRTAESEKDSAARRGRKAKSAWPAWLLPAEWYIVATIATGWLPENLRPDPNAGWVGLLVSRLTVITAIFGLTLLACVRHRRWHAFGFGAAATTFFLFLFQDTAWISRMEANAGRLLSQLPYGTRVVPDIDAPADWRVPFIVHSADRACIGHCFVFSNYEAASRQFRIRISPQGSPLVTASTDDAENMQSGEYTIRPTDPPLVLLYQCDDRDLRTLCLHHLKPGEKTRDPGPAEAPDQP